MNPLSRKPHRFIPTCDINQNWWDCYYSFMTSCRGPRGLDYWAYLPRGDCRTPPGQ